MARKSLKTEQDLIREAVDEHGKRGRPKGKRRAGKVNSFNYKEAETAKRKKADSFAAEQERVYGLREPPGPSEFDLFCQDLSVEQRVFALIYFRMECRHSNARVVAHRPTLGEIEDAMLVCDRCGSAIKWMGTKTSTNLTEWVSYCPDGFDMFDWQDLYVKDRGTWRFIHDEVLAEMVSDSMTKEDE